MVENTPLEYFGYDSGRGRILVFGRKTGFCMHIGSQLLTQMIVERSEKNIDLSQGKQILISGDIKRFTVDPLKDLSSHPEQPSWTKDIKGK